MSRFRLRTVGPLALLFLVLSFAAAPAELPDGWREMDDRLERARLLEHYMKRVAQPNDGYGAYLEKVRYEAEADSLGLAEWEALSAAEQDRRHRLTEPWRDRLDATRRTISRLYDSMVIPGSASPTVGSVLLEGGAELVLATMGALVNIVGLVPVDAVAWADLGYFAGCVGDTHRQEQALQVFCALHDGMAAREQQELHGRRIRVCLDLAWLARDQGRADDAVAHCLEADRWLEQDPGVVDLADREARLIAALARAEQGRAQEASELAAPLGDLPFRKRSIQTHRFTVSQPLEDRGLNARFSQAPGYWAMDTPNSWSPAHTVQKGAWERGASNWARQWVQALIRLRSGETADLFYRIGEPDPLREFPTGLNHHYWNDWGRIYEYLGRPAAARRCYAMAVMYRPFFVYYPLEGRRGFSRLHTTVEEARIYFAATGIHYAAGDLYAHAASCLLEWEFTEDEGRRAMLLEMAQDEFTACRNRGIRPTAALAQRGRLRYLSGDLARAATDLQTAIEEFGAAGEEEPDLLLMLGLVHFNGGDFRGALPWLEQFCLRKPEEGIGWRALGLAAAHSNKLAAADSAFSHSLALEPGDPGGWFNRGLVRAKSGRREEALADLEQAALLLPDHRDIVRVMEALEQGPLPDISLQSSPIILGTAPSAAAASERLQRVNLAAEMGTPALADLLAPDAGEEWNRAELEAAHLRDPSTANRARLARRYLADARPDLVQDLLVPVWDTGLTDDELLVLLSADRELGETGRAVALVHGLAGMAPATATPAVWQLVGVICLEADLGEQAGRALEYAESLMEAARPPDR